MSDNLKEYNSSRFTSDMVMKSISRDKLWHLISCSLHSSRSVGGIEESDDREPVFYSDTTASNGVPGSE